MDFEIDAAAIQEIGAAFRYYQERAPDLGDEFLDDIRRRLTPRFPFSVFYLASTDRITILAVGHQRRDPDHWRRPP